MIGYGEPARRREWPDIWIVASNVDPSPTPATGTYDKAKELVRAARPGLDARFHIWGRSTLLDYLHRFPDIVTRYGHLITAGTVLADLQTLLTADLASPASIIRTLICSPMEEQWYARLEEAGAQDDVKPPVHKIFVDVPFASRKHGCAGLVCDFLGSALVEQHKELHGELDLKQWIEWRSHPARAPVWFIKGGPGQGKSTIGQYVAQINRAALIRTEPTFLVPLSVRQRADEIFNATGKTSVWPIRPRVPLIVELKKYAKWLASRGEGSATGVLTYLSSELERDTEQKVPPGLLRKILPTFRWLAIFDGLDEVPSDAKERIASEIKKFISETRLSSDLFSICSSRPQGYSGHFNQIEMISEIELLPLELPVALTCASTLLTADRPPKEAQAAIDRLTEACSVSSAVRELMRTPLQVHIMTVIVRNGHKPPERRWQLFDTFYSVIRQREANRNLPDAALADVLQRETKLLREVHARLGFYLHARAETGEGAESQVGEDEFRRLVTGAVADAKEESEVPALVEVVMRAARERLVLINTPDKAGAYRFDVRQLQEFFAAEYLYGGIRSEELRLRLKTVLGDQHWREVCHFVVSALVEQNRRTELDVVHEVVASIDRGPDDGTEETLSARLARGALTVARLFNDGVFDELNGLRNIFKDLLEPLVSSLGETATAELVAASGNDSRPWLAEWVLRRAEGAAESEVTGAALVLWQSVGDADAIAGRVAQWFSERSDSFLGTVADVAQEDYEREVIGWHVDVGSAKLARATKMSSRILDIVWPFLTPSNGGAFAELLRRNGAPVDGERARMLLQQRQTAAETTEFGFASVEEYEISPAGRWVGELEGLRGAGLCAVLKAGLLCSERGRYEDYCALANALKSDRDAAMVIPGAVRERIAFPRGTVSWAEVAERLSATSAEDFQGALVGGDLGLAVRRYRVVRMHASASRIADEWEAKASEFATQDPRVVLNLWMIAGEQRVDLEPVFEILAGKVATLIREGELHIGAVPPTLWGDLAKVDRGIMETVRGRRWEGKAFQHHWGSRIGTGGKALFESQEDGALLPWYAGEVASTCSAWLGRPLWLGARNVDDWHSKGAESVCDAAGAADMIKVQQATSRSATERMSALLIRVAGRATRAEEIVDNRELIIEAANECHACGPAAAIIYEAFGGVWDARARSLFNTLLEGERRSGQRLSAWTALLDRWRERSDRPVTSRAPEMLSQLL